MKKKHSYKFTNSTGRLYELEFEIEGMSVVKGSVTLYENHTDTFWESVDEQFVHSYLFKPILSGENKIRVDVIYSHKDRDFTIFVRELVPTLILNSVIKAE